MDKLTWYEQVAEYITLHLEEFYELFYKSALVKVGSNYRLQPCPMCGHYDCATIGIAVHCFSCGWSGTHINAWIQYSTEKLHLSYREAIAKLEKFTHIPFPDNIQNENNINQQYRIQRILQMAENFYHQQLLKLTVKYQFKDRLVTPLEYLLSIRKRILDTIQKYKIGFSYNYLELHNQLIDHGFTTEEIKEAGVWIPEGFFVFFYKNPFSHNIVRINTKNPFNVEVNGEILKGFSRGNKAIYFSDPFSFKKPIFIVEGEHDMFALLEKGISNVCCIGGNPDNEQLEILNRAESTMYLVFDNDEAGQKYLIKFNNELFPEKDLKVIKFPKEYKDIDEYLTQANIVDLTSLINNAESLETEGYKIIRKNIYEWIITNRHKKIEFIIKYKNDKGHLCGTINCYINGVLTDRDEDIPLNKCKAKMKPFNFYLADAIEHYFNENLEEKSIEELAQIYWFSKRKAKIIELLAQYLYRIKDNPTAYEQLINQLKIQLKTPDGKDDVVDSILKEINDLQNKEISQKNRTIIPKISISQYFNVTNNDAYFYFNKITQDGDTIRRLPYLLRNDKQLIRLDLIKRKDSQCLLLLDNKYELPFEINEAVIEEEECSLTQEWVEKYINNEIPPSELDPSYLIEQIENYIFKFYHTNNPDIYKVLALYIYGTYYYQLFSQYPYLYINGEKGSGKSVLDMVIYLLAFNAQMCVDVTEAALFRMASVIGGTIILDEIENLTSRSKAADSSMASIIKSGYARAAKVKRANMDKRNAIENFDVYGPKVISNIFGLEDVIADRCIIINTYRYNVNKYNKKEDPKFYRAERLDEIKALTSKCCLSAIENFQLVHKLYTAELFETNNARLSQILTPLLTIAKLVDKSYENNSIGKYETALLNFYNNILKVAKEEIESNTPEYIIKKCVKRIAEELWGLVPQEEIEYTNPDNHKYNEPIKYNKEEGWFEINVLHFKCFLEEYNPGEVYLVRSIPKWVKTCFHFNDGDIKRRYITVDNEELLKEFKGNSRPKVNFYRFYFKDFIDMQNDFLNTQQIDATKCANLNLF